MNISKMTIGGVQYDIKDAEARELISNLQLSTTGGMHYVGITTTELSDGATVSTITVDGNDIDAAAGDVAIYGEMEYVYSGTKWQEFGSTGSLKALAFVDSAKGSVTAAGTNTSSAVSFDGTSSENVLKSVSKDAVAPSFTEGTFNAGSLPTFTEGAFSQGTLPSLGSATTSSFAKEGIVATASVIEDDDYQLTFTSASVANAVTAQGAFSAGTLPSKAADSFTQGTLPSKAADSFNAGSAAEFNTQAVITNIGTATAAAQTFTGSAVNVTVSAAA